MGAVTFVLKWNTGAQWAGAYTVGDEAASAWVWPVLFYFQQPVPHADLDNSVRQ